MHAKSLLSRREWCNCLVSVCDVWMFDSTSCCITSLMMCWWYVISAWHTVCATLTCLPCLEMSQPCVVSKTCFQVYTLYIQRLHLPNLAMHDSDYDLCAIWHAARVPRLFCSIRVYYACVINNYAHYVKHAFMNYQRLKSYYVYLPCGSHEYGVKKCCSYCVRTWYDMRARRLQTWELRRHV